jgi:BlaI family transcriptional regulator, penicillinase repressor
MPVKKSTAPRPTDSELTLLRVLWDRGAATVREVHEEVSRSKTLGYTTVLKFLQIMTEKGLVKRDESARTHIYRPAVPPERMQRSMVTDLVQRLFAGSTQALVQQALGSGRVTAGEIAEIRRTLDALEKKP